METIVVERTIAAPITDVFDWVSNAHNYTRIGLVLAERLRVPGEGAPYGLGAIRFVLCAGACFWERMTAYDPPRSFEYHIDRSFPPLVHERGHLEFTETPTGTRVVWTTTAHMRFPVPALAGVLTRRVMRPLLNFAFAQILATAARDLGDRTAA